MGTPVLFVRHIFLIGSVEGAGHCPTLWKSVRWPVLGKGDGKGRRGSLLRPWMPKRFRLAGDAQPLYDKGDGSCCDCGRAFRRLTATWIYLSALWFLNASLDAYSVNYSSGVIDFLNIKHALNCLELCELGECSNIALILVCQLFHCSLISCNDCELDFYLNLKLTIMNDV